MRDAFPNARVIRCLQHVKKNIMKARKEWVSFNHGKKVKDWFHRSAFLEPGLFSMFWHGGLEELQADGEGNFAAWLLDPARGGHLHLDPDTGVITAPWQSSLAHIEPPFSAYSQNAIESSWKAMDVALDDMPRRVDILAEIDHLKQLTKMWHKKGTASNVQPQLILGRGRG